jgi:hypothetical protein
MIKRFFALLVLLAVFSAPVYADSCPIQMKKIDKALAKNPSLTAEQLAEVKRLRTLGEKQHKSLEHSESASSLWDAMDILEIS